MEGYNKFEIQIAGDALLQHNGQLADPLNKHSKALKAVSGRRKKTDADHEELSNLEYRAGLYLDSKDRVIIPGRVLETVILQAAKKTREGQLAASGVFVDTDGVLDYAGGPLSPEELVASPEHRLTIGVRVGQVRVMRTRPLFRDWSTSFQVSLLNTVADGSTLEKWLKTAGALVGIGDYRPRYGRFELVSFEEV